MKKFSEICDAQFGYTVSSDIDFYTYEHCAKIFSEQIKAECLKQTYKSLNPFEVNQHIANINIDEYL